MQKVLYSILKNSGGHISAARAIIACLDELKIETLEHKLIDFTLQIRTFWTNVAYAYQLMNESFPWAWKTLYYSTNNPKTVTRFNNFFYPLLYRKKALQIFHEEKPNVVVCLTGPSTGSLARVIKDLGKPIPLISVVLDPVSFHASWIDPGIDCLIVGTEESRNLAIKYGMPEERVKVIGFPIHPTFLQDYGKKEDIRRSFDLRPETFTVLLMGGGAGIGRVFDIARALDSTDLNIQLIVVAGFNKKLELKFLRNHFHFPVKVFGFTDRIPEIMAASDVMITKAGPGAVFEAIAKELPLIITGCIPGQEEGNLDYVEKNRLGIIAREPEKIIEAVRRLQTTGTDEFKSNMRRIRNPAAVYEIAKLIASYLK